MQSRAPNFEALFKKCKEDYDQLLQKNQNDLIKIKMRQKQLNDKISSYTQQNQRLQLQIDQLRAAKGRGTVVKSVEDSHQSDSLIRSLRSGLQDKQQEVEALSRTVNELRKEHQESRRAQRTIRADLATVREELDDTRRQLSYSKQQAILDYKEWQNKVSESLQAQNEDTANRMNEQMAQLLASKQQIDCLTGQLREARQHLQQSEARSSQLEGQLQSNKRKRVESQKQVQLLAQQGRALRDQQCDRCKDLQQKVQLQQEMLKSVRMMLRFKEMELQKVQK